MSDPNALYNAHASPAWDGAGFNEYGAMSQWDYFAAAALTGCIANPNRSGSAKEIAEGAALVADQMILERSQRLQALTTKDTTS